MSNIVAEIVRCERVESVHRGHIAISDDRSRLRASFGDPEFQTYMRSAAKPFQFMPLLENGVAEQYGFTERELAVMIASHNGEADHVEAVRSILQKIGLTEQALRCGIHTPMSKAVTDELLRQKQDFTVLHNNCSGKHCAMLALAKFKGWPLETYLKPDHPVQKSIREKILLFTGLSDEELHVGTDGCSAPVYYLSVKNMADMFAKLAAGKLPLTERVFTIMATNPQMIAGTGRFDTDLMQVMQGRVVSKVGAEGIRCVGVRAETPVGIALKIEDGQKRASESVLLEVMRQLNLITPAELEELSQYYNPIMVNHSNITTGFLKARFRLQRVSD